MIVELAQVKALLGIELDDETEDTHLTQLILAATEWLQGETKRRFDTPIDVIEFREGNGNRKLYLRGHIDRSAPPVGESAEPGNSLTVSIRAIGDVGEDWEMLNENEHYEVRGNVLYGSGWCGGQWDRSYEYQLEYLSGYWVAPEDIQQIVLELVIGQYNADIANAAGTAGVTSEKLGDYSYTVDLGAAAGSSVGISSGSLSGNAWRTIERYRRVFI